MYWYYFIRASGPVPLQSFSGILFSFDGGDEIWEAALDSVFASRISLHSSVRPQLAIGRAYQAPWEILQESRRRKSHASDGVLAWAWGMGDGSFGLVWPCWRSSYMQYVAHIATIPSPVVHTLPTTSASGPPLASWADWVSTKGSLWRKVGHIDAGTNVEWELGRPTKS